MLPDSFLGETLCIQQSRFFINRSAWFTHIYENYEPVLLMQTLIFLILQIWCVTI